MQAQQHSRVHCKLRVQVRTQVCQHVGMPPLCLACTHHAAPVLQVLLVVYSWAGRGGKLPFLMSGSPMESSTAFTEASLASEL